MSGQVINVVFIVIAIEITVLTIAKRDQNSGLRFKRLLSLIAPGAFIFLALKAALTGDNWMLIAGYLILSGLAHGFDVWLRLQETKPRPTTKTHDKEAV